MIEFLRKIFFIRSRCRVCSLHLKIRMQFVMLFETHFHHHHRFESMNFPFEILHMVMIMAIEQFVCLDVKHLPDFSSFSRGRAPSFYSFIFPAAAIRHRHRHCHQLVLLSLCLIFCVIILVTHILTHKNEYIQLIMPHYFSSFIFILLGKRLQKGTPCRGRTTAVE